MTNISTLFGANILPPAPTSPVPGAPIPPILSPSSLRSPTELPLPNISRSAQNENERMIRSHQSHPTVVVDPNNGQQQHEYNEYRRQADNYLTRWVGRGTTFVQSSSSNWRSRRSSRTSRQQPPAEEQQRLLPPLLEDTPVRIPPFVPPESSYSFPFPPPPSPNPMINPHATQYSRPRPTTQVHNNTASSSLFPNSSTPPQISNVPQHDLQLHSPIERPPAPLNHHPDIIIPPRDLPGYVEITTNRTYRSANNRPPGHLYNPAPHRNRFPSRVRRRAEDLERRRSIVALGSDHRSTTSSSAPRDQVRVAGNEMAPATGTGEPGHVHDIFSRIFGPGGGPPNLIPSVNINPHRPHPHPHHQHRDNIQNDRPSSLLSNSHGFDQNQRVQYGPIRPLDPSSPDDDIIFSFNGFESQQREREGTFQDRRQSTFSAASDCSDNPTRTATSPGGGIGVPRGFRSLIRSEESSATVPGHENGVYGIVRRHPSILPPYLIRHNSIPFSHNTPPPPWRYPGVFAETSPSSITGDSNGYRNIQPTGTMRMRRGDSHLRFDEDQDEEEEEEEEEDVETEGRTTTTTTTNWLSGTVGPRATGDGNQLQRLEESRSSSQQQLLWGKCPVCDELGCPIFVEGKGIHSETFNRWKNEGLNSFQSTHNDIQSHNSSSPSIHNFTQSLITSPSSHLFRKNANGEILCGFGKGKKEWRERSKDGREGFGELVGR